MGLVNTKGSKTCIFNISEILKFLFECVRQFEFWKESRTDQRQRLNTKNVRTAKQVGIQNS